METLAPTRCATCDDPGVVLCPTCADELPFIDLHSACPRCGAPYGYFLCTECGTPNRKQKEQNEAFPFEAARCALEFRDKARGLIRTYKDKDELRLDATIASLICAALRGRKLSRPFDNTVSAKDAKRCKREISLRANMLEDWTQWADALAYVPASPQALLRRGFDHMERIAALCARRTGLEAPPLLISTKHALDQRHLGRGERLANRRASFELMPSARKTRFIPRRIVLIDDVLTTGATLSAATEALLEAGACEVRVVTCCRVW